MWRPDFYGESGEAGAGAQVGYADVVSGIKIFHHRGHRGHRGKPWEQVAGGEEGLAEVAGRCRVGIKDCWKRVGGGASVASMDLMTYSLLPRCGAEWRSLDSAGT